MHTQTARFCWRFSAALRSDTINIAFGNAAGLPTLQTGQWYAIVLLAEVLGLEAASADAFRQAASAAALALTLRCGSQALESSPLDIREPGGVLELRSLGSAATLEVAPGSTTRLTMKGLLGSGAIEKLRMVFLPSFGPQAWSVEGSSVAASVQYWSSADATGQPAGSQSISGVSLTLSTRAGLPATVLDLQLPGWTSMGSLEVSLALAAASPLQGLATGFAAHAYVWAELRRSTRCRKAAVSLFQLAAERAQWLDSCAFLTHGWCQPASGAPSSLGLRGAWGDPANHATGWNLGHGPWAYTCRHALASERKPSQEARAATCTCCRPSSHQRGDADSAGQYGSLAGCHLHLLHGCSEPFLHDVAEYLVRSARFM
ncbi:unnamed protein product [Symbiodinium natans]|uniref:Uncharacterized protein n=1 Tax=Symbiodinium natans TaxID=878477 RepID=A0A812SGU3_9DINO|nr:unnamed protein product [Symbiodinium natans]